MRPYDVDFDISIHFDAVVTSCGFENRSTFLCRQGLRGVFNYAIELPGTNQYISSSRDVYMAADWQVSSLDIILIDLQSKLARTSSPKVLIDISSMPRIVLAKMVQWLCLLPFSITIQFAYCPATFTDSERAAKYAAPLSAAPVTHYFSGALRAPSLPIGLVIGLGLEPHRAMGLMELLEPSRTWAFLAESEDRRFELAAEAMHNNLSTQSGELNVLRYRTESLAHTFNSLESLSFATGQKFRLLYAPSGPKIFSLACLLVAAPRTTERAAVWRVGRDSTNSTIQQIEASGAVYAAEVIFAK